MIGVLMEFKQKLLDVLFIISYGDIISKKIKLVCLEREKEER